MFEKLQPQPADSLLSLIKLYKADARADKIDLGVGVYRDENGRTPVFKAVKLAEQRLVEQQESKSYLGPEGDMDFVAAIADLVLGSDTSPSNYSGLQTPGGTGALRLALELYVRNVPSGTVWVGTPTWPVHESMLKALGANVQHYEYYHVANQTRVPDAVLNAARSAKADDLFLLHGCCHNPTGANLDAAEWAELGDVLADRGIMPLIDLAYHGLGRGLKADSEGLRILAGKLPELLLAYSCDKNFGVYRDRVGAVFAFCRNAEDAELSRGNFAVLARNNWSMPPDHGGVVVGMILRDQELRKAWENELSQMQTRLARVRALLAAHGKSGDVDLAPLGKQTGMFAMLPLSPNAILALRERHGVYMAGNGRINVAGLSEKDCDRFVAALGDVAGI